MLIDVNELWQKRDREEERGRGREAANLADISYIDNFSFSRATRRCRESALSPLHVCYFPSAHTFAALAAASYINY